MTLLALASLVALQGTPASRPPDLTVQLYFGAFANVEVYGALAPGQREPLWVEVSEDAYLTILDVTPGGGLRVVHPFNIDRSHWMGADGIRPVLVRGFRGPYWYAPGGFGFGYLVAIASREPLRLRGTLRRIGPVARWGGNEYTVLTGTFRQSSVLDAIERHISGPGVAMSVLEYFVVSPLPRPPRILLAAVPAGVASVRRPSTPRDTAVTPARDSLADRRYGDDGDDDPPARIRDRLRTPVVADGSWLMARDRSGEPGEAIQTPLRWRERADSRWRTGGWPRSTSGFGQHAWGRRAWGDADGSRPAGRNDRHGAGDTRVTGGDAAGSARSPTPATPRSAPPAERRKR